LGDSLPFDESSQKLPLGSSRDILRILEPLTLLAAAPLVRERPESKMSLIEKGVGFGQEPAAGTGDGVLVVMPLLEGEELDVSILH